MTQRVREAKTVVSESIWRGRTAAWLMVAASTMVSACGPPKEAPPPSLVADPPPTDDGRAPGAGQSDVDRAIAYIEKEAWDKALPHLETALAAQPSNAEIHYYMALAKSRLGNVDEARSGFEKALELDPGLTLARAHLAEIYLTSDPVESKKAVDVLGPAVKAEPEAPDLHQLLGFAHRMERNYDASAKHYKASLSAKDDDQVRFDYADMLFEAKRYDESAAQMRRLLPKFAENKKVLAQLAHRLAKAKAYDDCVNAFTKAIAIDAKEPGFYLHRGLCQHSLKKEKLARADYQKAIDLDGKFQPAWYYMGMSWLEDRKRTQARQALDRAYKLDRDSKVGKAAKAKLDELR
ncbi:MAG TPA: tetratricopeptide repeat protein [Polyangiaceae bacterium]|nr:tetratricopeptide repeat protein [Polyangiaceae bacterium]